MKEKEFKQVNIRLEKELSDFLEIYAEDNFKTVAGILREFIVKIYRENKDLLLKKE